LQYNKHVFCLRIKSLSDGNLYIGYTNDLKRRLREHNEGVSKSTKFRRPFELIYFEGCINIKDAINREKYLKTTYGHQYVRNRLKNYLEDV
jgi:putative endonuclease